MCSDSCESRILSSVKKEDIMLILVGVVIFIFILVILLLIQGLGALGDAISENGGCCAAIAVIVVLLLIVTSIVLVIYVGTHSPALPPAPPAGSNLAGPRISVPAPASATPAPAVSNPASQPALLPCFTTNMAGGYGEIKQGPLDGGATWGMQIKFSRDFDKGAWSNIQVIEISRDQKIVHVNAGQTATLWFSKNC